MFSFYKGVFESKYYLLEEIISWVLGTAFIQQCAFVYIYEGLKFLKMSNFCWDLKVAALSIRRAPHLVPRRVTSPLLWKHWATNETIFTKFGFKGFPFWPIEGGLHFCWLEKREFCYLTPVKYFKKYIS